MGYELEKLGLGWSLRPHRRRFPAALETRARQGVVNVTTGRGQCHMPRDEVGARCASRRESGSRRDALLLTHGWTRFRRQISEKII